MENLRLLEDIFLSQEEDDFSNVEREWLENNMPQDIE